MEGKQKLLCYARVLSPNMRLRQSKGHEAGICLKILFNISMEFDLFFSLREICMSNTAMLKTDVYVLSILLSGDLAQLKGLRI